jgi:hypothetical protein
MLRKAMATTLPITKLFALQHARTLVRVHRTSLEEGHATGRIVGCSRKLLALSVVGDGVRPDGFYVLRRADISAIDAPDPYADFVIKALRLRGQALPKLPRLDLTSWRSLLTGAARRFPLITLHPEVTKPDSCYIGLPVRMTSRAVTLVTVGPDGHWDGRDALFTLAWSEVTRVSFGGDYEEALALVAGKERA